MGLRFHRVLRLLPGVRVNLSKSTPSLSVGPKGADLNIGRHGITTNAGIPGTGLSWRQKLGGKGSVTGILMVVAGIGWWAYGHRADIQKFIAPAVPQPVVQSQAAPAAQAIKTPANITTPAERPAVRHADEGTLPGPRYVRRAGSVLRAEAKASAKTLKKESKGAKVTVTAIDADGWASVTDGNLTGYMRASVLGMDPPPTP